ncbi:hypothetical protein SAMD00019534_101980 [Acytostelium subglobosum LB1]|uniref:hypothetical protein n=1 Tax=Acytostelium subglobosum LB1 TaxID=1410327 RepID=UPI000644F9AC|nr:hypothetical protein SAMD00019534_101980 [Acytostelium subglobosum LB1]GAM27023.1 hypothetical protein SAMD00019534_101980 [Acytostelium subglobosum LB1]|eukprot:XP_012749903.1 hypothetical protein SAMD00019534_101980 [Acytostelium subglobosum LB1]
MNNQQVDQPAQIVAPAGALPADAPLAGAPLVEVVVAAPPVPEVPPAKHAPLGAPAPLGGPPIGALVVAKPAPLVPRQITVHYANIDFDITVNGNTRYRDIRARILENPDSVNLHNLRNLQGCVIEYRPAAVNAAVANSNALIPVGMNHVYITEPLEQLSDPETLLPPMSIIFLSH